MTQVTQTKLKELNVLQLYEHYGALERSLPLLTPESQDMARAELETCAKLRSEKIDRIHYAMASHEDAVERVKQEIELLSQARRHHEAQLRGLKGLLSWLRRALPKDENKITGRKYQFVLVKKKDLTVEISSDVEHWHTDERMQFCIEQEVTTTKQTVVRSMDGTILETKIEPKTKTEIIPNLDAIRNAYQTGQPIPHGVKVTQDYSIRTKRIVGEPGVDEGLVAVEASEHLGEVLREAGASD
jgi:hypothetical protein